MCAAAIGHARLSRLYYGASDPKSGGIETGPRVFDHPNLHHRPEIISGLQAEECGHLLEQFFKSKRLQSGSGNS